MKQILSSLRTLITLAAIAGFAFAPGPAARAQGTQFGITPSAAKTLAVTTTTGNVQLGTFGTTVVVWNIGANEAFFNIGIASNTAATTSSASLPGGSCIVVNSPPSAYFAAITASSTTTLRLVQGNGATACGVSVASSTSVTVTTSPTDAATTMATAAPTALTFASILAAAPTRKACFIQNVGTTLGYLYFGATGSATTGGSLQVAPGQAANCGSGDGVVSNDNVAATCASGTCAFIVASQ